LKHEKFFYLAGDDPCAKVDKWPRQLAESGKALTQRARLERLAPAARTHGGDSKHDGDGKPRRMTGFP
jgi:hypothetical protein